MKTVNGNNKLERQINKAKKYVGVNLVEFSNKYLEVKSVDDIDNTYILFLSDYSGQNARLVKDNELWVIKPLNLEDDEKPVFVKRWATIEEYGSYWFNNASFIIFKTENERFKELAEGCDDLWNLDNFIKEKSLKIKKR